MGSLRLRAETRQAVQSAVRVLQQRGFDIRPFRPKGLEQARKLWSIFFVQLWRDVLCAGDSRA